MSNIQTSDSLETGWEHFSHVADIGVRGFGSTMAASFEQAALALTSVVAELEVAQALDGNWHAQCIVDV
jgi:SHS2 domain-containing protein